MPKREWNAALVRSLWLALESCMARRKESADREEAWLILAGFLLRPGFGAVRLERIAGWDLHPLESAALSRRTPEADTQFGMWLPVKHVFPNNALLFD
jgi:hypothetical protein